MERLFSARAAALRSSFVRDILKAASDPAITSFAGGLPNPVHFPAAELACAAERVLSDSAGTVLQYSSSEGLGELREWIADRYRDRGLNIAPERILITSGSQQALDLLGKVLLDPGDGVALEAPGYLGAIQAFSLYRPQFLPVPLSAEGLDTSRLEHTLRSQAAKLLYTVPNFQNPSGATYSTANREALAQLLAGREMLLIEDDPYGELRFAGEPAPSFAHLLPRQTVLLGSFSKSVAPAFRLGWVVAPPWLMQRLLLAKQATDLHSNSFSQHVLLRYLRNESLDDHLARVRTAYAAQMQAMLAAIGRHFPAAARVAPAKGGMFLWATLPEGTSTVRLFERAMAEKVAFVPGHPFYLDRNDSNDLRLNFTNAEPEAIESGIARLGRAMATLPDEAQEKRKTASRRDAKAQS